MSWHIAETKEQARQEAVDGLHRWHNEYNVRRPRPARARLHVDDPWELLDQVAETGAEGGGAAVIGTPDDLIAAIQQPAGVTGGFGVVLGFAHDWANRENARALVGPGRPLRDPGGQRHVRPMQASADYVERNKAELIGRCVGARS